MPDPGSRTKTYATKTSSTSRKRDTKKKIGIVHELRIQPMQNFCSYSREQTSGFEYHDAEQENYEENLTSGTAAD